jgi:electron transfer flavoprotein beta subunit
MVTVTEICYGGGSRNLRVLNVIVCMKVVMDPEISFSTFKIDKENKKPLPPLGSPPVFSPFDENALESALRIKDKHECKVTVLSLGKTLPKAVLQKALAAGADEAIAVEAPYFENLDPFSTAGALAHAIRKAGDFDLVFTGRQAADWDAGLVWAGIAELLDLACITVARAVDVQNGRAVVERCVSDGVEILEAELPALVTFSNESGELRNITLPALIKAKRQEVLRLSASDVGFEKVDLAELRDLFIPELGVLHQYMVPGENLQEKGRNLARKLMEDGILKRPN